MSKGTQHSDEKRAQVTAALLSGQGVREVSRELKVPVATVSRYKRDMAAPRAASSARAAREISESGAGESAQNAKTQRRKEKDMASHVPTPQSSLEKWRESRISPDGPDGDFAPDDSATFDADVEAGLRGDDGEEWSDSDDYFPAGRAPMELSEADENYECPVQQSRLRGVPLEHLGTQKKERPNLDALIFDYLAENLATLRAQAIISRDPRWVKRYGPDALAILHGVIADKTIRILECAEAGRPIEAEVVTP